MSLGNIKIELERLFKEPFIGNKCGFSSDEIEEIIKEAKNIFNRIKNDNNEKIRKDEYKIIVFSIVELTKNWNPEDGAWLRYLSSKLLEESDGFKGRLYNELVNSIENSVEDNGFFLINSYKKKFYATICCHSFSTKKSVTSLFEMCRSVFFKDFQGEYSENKKFLNIIAEKLKNKILLENDESGDNDLNVGNKAYTLRVGIKGLIVDHQKLFIEKLHEIFTAIDNFYNNVPPLSKDTYFKVLLDEWINNKKEELGTEKAKHKTAKRDTVTNYSQIKAKYILEDNTPMIHITPFVIEDECDVEPTMEIKVNEKVVLTESVPLYCGTGVFLRAEPKNCNINKLTLNFNDTVSVVIKIKDKIIYDSKNTLKRDFVIFKDDREVTGQSLLPGCYSLYTTSLQNLKRPKECRWLAKNIYFINALDEDALISPNKIVFFENEKNKDCRFFCRERDDISYKLNGNHYAVVDGELYFDISKDMNTNDIAVQYNDKAEFRLNEFEKEEIDGLYRYKLSILSDYGEPVSIKLLRFSDNFIISALYLIKFKNISVSYDKPLYYGNEINGKVEINTDNYHFEQEFCATDDNYITLNDGELHFKPPVLRWRFDSTTWSNCPNEDRYFYTKYGNTERLYIDKPENIELVTALNSKVLTYSPDSKSYNFGEILHSSVDGKDDFMVLFIRNGDIYYPIMTIITKDTLLIKQSIITIQPYSYNLTVDLSSFIGNDDTILKLYIYNLNGKPVKILTNLARGKNELDLKTYNVKRGQYLFKVVAIQNPIFSPKTIILCEKSWYVGSFEEDAYQDKEIVITAAILFNGKARVNLQNYVITNIEFLGRNEEGTFYKGILGRKNRKIELEGYDDKIYRETHNIKLNPIKFKKKNRTSIYIEYGLDVNSNTYDCIDEFQLSAKKQLSVKKDKNNLDIDYFLIQVEESKHV